MRWVYDDDDDDGDDKGEGDVMVGGGEDCEYFRNQRPLFDCFRPSDFLSFTS